MSDQIQKSGFSGLGIAPHVLKSIERLGFTVPTPIQMEAIPAALEGRDLIGIAQTGTGKTLAFGAPMMSTLERGQVGLILAPTRELAIQIEETLRSLGARTALLIGGAPMGRQVQQLRREPQIICATPGRLIDHLQQGTTNLRRVTVVVLDEADRMLDMGFQPAIERILLQTPKQRQTMLFSATMPPEVLKLANNYLNDPLQIEVARPGVAAEDVEQELFVLNHEDKPEMLRIMLGKVKGSVLVFARTRHGARKLATMIRSFGHSAAEIHSDRTLSQRQTALRGFKSGEFRILAATDIAARGIDVKDIEMVINYDLPDHPEDYIHRIGRTGRAGASGRAVTFALPDQARDVRDIEKHMEAEIPLSEFSPLAMPTRRPQPAPRGANTASARPHQKGGRRWKGRFASNERPRR